MGNAKFRYQFRLSVSAVLLLCACSKEMRSDMPRENQWGQKQKREPDPEVSTIDPPSLPAAPAETVEDGPRPNPKFHIRVSNVSNQPIEFAMRRPVSPDLADWYEGRNALVVETGEDFKTFVVPGVGFTLAPRSSILIRAYNGPVSFAWTIKLDRDPRKWLRGVISATIPSDTGVDIPNGLKGQVE